MDPDIVSIDTPPQKSKEEELWELVNKDARDFSSWTKLIVHCERENDIEKIRKAFDGFLSNFPLCYVFWEKYAKHEAKHGNREQALTVFKRGTSDDGVPHSVHLWLSYCLFVKDSGDVAATRKVFEEAVSVVGTDWAADQLWEKYLEFEASYKELQRITALFKRILAIPLGRLTDMFERFKAHLAAHELEEVLLDEDRKQLEAEGKELSRDALTELYNRIYTASKIEHDLRYAWEIEIGKRPYYHTQPMKDEHLVIWHQYLDFMEKKEDVTSTRKLYERCIIPCCEYPEFWVRYATFLESHDVNEARTVFHRGLKRTPKDKLELQLQYAYFEETQQQADVARDIYVKLTQENREDIECLLRHASFEKRQGNTQAAISAYENGIKSLPANCQPFVVIHFARFLQQAVGDIEHARRVYDQGIQDHPECKKLWVAYIQFELNLPGDAKEKENNITALHKRAEETPQLLQSDRKSLALQHIEYLADLGADISKYRREEIAYKKKYVFNSSSRKRAGDHSIYQQPQKVQRQGQYDMSQYGQYAAQYAAYYQQQGYAWPGYGAAAYGYPMSNS